MIDKIKKYYEKYYTVFDIVDKKQDKKQIISRLVFSIILSLSVSLINIKILNIASDKISKKVEEKADLISNENLSYEEKCEKRRNLYDKYEKIATFGVAIPIVIFNFIEQITIQEKFNKK